MHKLLERQLRKCFDSKAPADPRFSAFVGMVNDAYEASDEDRALLERSIELASAELLERNERLNRDLAEIRRLELELRQADKLRAVGQLAAGIAHEINTPVQFVSDCFYFLRSAHADVSDLWRTYSTLRDVLRDGGDPAPVIEQMREKEETIGFEELQAEISVAFDRIAEGLDRVAHIVAAMKGFSRTDQREKVAGDVNDCLASTLTVARSELKYVADVETDFGELPHVPCYPSELNQVFLNLLLNAAHAVEERHGPSKKKGAIRIRTRADDAWVTVTISDDGCGIRKSAASRVFEPFFTTKAPGKGTGQGLAIAHSIVVDKHGGTLTFDSTEGEGTTFVVKIPRFERRQPVVEPFSIPAREAAV